MIEVRRLTLWLMVVTVLAVACNGKDASSTTSTVDRTPSISRATRAQFDRFYPEYASANLKLRTTSTIKTPSGTPTMVLNFTEYQLKPAVIQGLYAVLEEYGSSPLVVDGFDENTTIGVFGRDAAMRTMLLIPDGVVKPRSTVSEFLKRTDPPAATSFDDGGNLFTYIEVRTSEFRSGYFATLDSFATFNAAIEVCQQTLVATILNAAGARHEDQSQALNAQELVCNSLGGAVGSAALGMPYELYETFAQSHPVGLQDGTSTPAIIVPKDVYYSYPELGVVIR